MKRVFALVLLLLPALAQPVARELKATVVGDGVGWETHAFRIWLVIPEKGRVRLDLFSPGFDPGLPERPSGETGARGRALRRGEGGA